MFTEWMGRYFLAAARAIVTHGDVVEHNESSWGWKDYRATQHVQGLQSAPGECEIVSATQLREEDDFLEIQDTFNSETYHIMEVTVECECGQLNGRKMRWRGTMVEAMDIMFEDGKSKFSIDNADVNLLTLPRTF